MMHAILLAAEAEAEQAPPTWVQYLPLIAMLALGYFLLFRPIRRQEQERRALVATLKKNARVITQSGIIGTILKIKDDDEVVTLKLEEGRIQVLKSSILRALAGGDTKETSEEKEEERKSD